MRKGQALIVVLLALVVVMTVALSIASRSVTEVSVSTAQEESARALAAAEAGIEAKLGGVSGGDTNVSVGTESSASTYTVTSDDFGAGNNPLPLSQRLASGESVSVDFTGEFVYGANSIGVCWSGTGSLETAYYYGPPVVVVRGYVDNPGGCPLAEYSGYNYKNVDLAAGSPKLFLKLKLLGNATKDQLVIVPAAPLPKQGDVITAVGQAGDSVRKVEVKKQVDRPDIFEAALFSGTSLVK